MGYSLSSTGSRTSGFRCVWFQVTWKAPGVVPGDLTGSRCGSS
ncbi:rCG43124 [Rattus norvegicus]|uniref:RCG43124 n=1 Tax=Rattus norvegicus TaxID=10116 RepID=A6IWG2_RAT|nr:rCG43124 [Rattus norvegicus]